MDETQSVNTQNQAILPDKPVFYPASESENQPAENPVNEPVNETPQVESEPEIGITSDGGLNVSDEFWNEDKDDKTAHSPVDMERQKTATQTEQAFYSDDELRETPFEQWDEKRLTGDVSRFVPIFKEQLARRKAQAEFEARHAQLQQQTASQAPQPYSPKELAVEAKKLAKQRLGLANDDEVDMYDEEHNAAMVQAMGEVQAQRQAEIARYQSMAQGQANFARFFNDLSARSDFQDFDRWVTAVLATQSKTPAMLGEYMKQTGDFEGGARTMAAWYQAYQSAKRQSAQPQVRSNPPNYAPKVPSLENAGNAMNTGARALNSKQLGDMSDDEQVQAFINSGFVKNFM